MVPPSNIFGFAAVRVKPARYHTCIIIGEIPTTTSTTTTKTSTTRKQQRKRVTRSLNGIVENRSPLTYLFSF